MLTKKLENYSWQYIRIILIGLVWIDIQYPTTKESKDMFNIDGSVMDIDSIILTVLERK